MNFYIIFKRYGISYSNVRKDGHVGGYNSEMVEANKKTALTVFILDFFFVAMKLRKKEMGERITSYSFASFFSSRSTIFVFFVLVLVFCKYVE